MITFDRRQYWEKKILGWERARYYGSAWLRPNSWTLRRRMRLAIEIISQQAGANARILDLGCGSGLFAERLFPMAAQAMYVGVDFSENAIREAKGRGLGARAEFHQADVLAAELPSADVTVFLGLLDWLDDREGELLFGRLRSPVVLFSFTELHWLTSWGPYRWYRAYYDNLFGGGAYKARSYSRTEILEWVKQLGPGTVEILPSGPFDPGRLVLFRRASS